MLRTQLKVIEPLVIIALLVGMILVTVAPVSACSCMMMSPAEEFASADAVFAGEVTAMQKDNEQFTVSITVLHTWKGDDAIDDDTIVVTTPLDSAACGYTFEADETYLIYALLQDETLHVTSCGNTAPLLDALNQFAIVGTDLAAAANQPNSPLAAPESPLATPEATKKATAVATPTKSPTAKPTAKP